MFDLDASKIVIVGVAALIFIPPKDLPRVMRQVGQFVGKMRRMANEFQGQFMDAMREADMADLRQEAQKLSDSVRIDAGLNSVHDIDRHMMPLSTSAKAPATDADALARSARAEPAAGPSVGQGAIDPPSTIGGPAGSGLSAPTSPGKTAAFETHPTA